MAERKPTGLLHACDDLKRLIVTNPELPILVMAGETASSGDYSWMACYRVQAEIGEFLDCDNEADNERVYTDRSDFEEDLGEKLSYDKHESDEALDDAIRLKMAEYEPYWKKCIIVHVDN